MTIPGSTNGCFDPPMYLRGDTVINRSWVHDSDTAWPQFRIELVFIVLHMYRAYGYGRTGTFMPRQGCDT